MTDEHPKTMQARVHDGKLIHQEATVPVRIGTRTVGTAVVHTDGTADITITDPTDSASRIFNDLRGISVGFDTLPMSVREVSIIDEDTP